MPQVQTVCFGAAAQPAMVKEQRLARHQPARRVLSARLDNPAAYPPRACLSSRNGQGRKAGRKSISYVPVLIGVNHIGMREPGIASLRDAHTGQSEIVNHVL